MHNTGEEQASSTTPFSARYLGEPCRVHRKALFDDGSVLAQRQLPARPARHSSSTARPSSAQPGHPRHSPAKPGQARNSPGMPGIARHSTAQPSPAIPSTAQPSPAQPGTARQSAPGLPGSQEITASLHTVTILTAPTLPVNQLMKQDCFFLTKQCTDTRSLEGCLLLPAAEGSQIKIAQPNSGFFFFVIFIQSCRNTLSPWQCRLAWWKSKSSFEAAECLLRVTMEINVGRGGGFADGNCCYLVEMF